MRAVPTAAEIFRHRQGRVFDIVYQIEDKNAAQEERQQTVAIDNLAALMGMMARFSFLTTFTPIGSELRARLNDDMADQLMSTDEYGLPTNISSFGIAEIYLPEKELRRFAPFYLAKKATERIIGYSLEEEARNDAFLQFCGKLGLDEQLFGLLESIAFRPLNEGGNQPLKEGYLEQSKKHDEERLFTRPEWRFLPDVSPIENPDDPMISIYALQGVVAGRLVYKEDSGTYWYVSFSGSEELMGRDSKEVTDYLLSHQTFFYEIVSSFYARLRLFSSSDALAQAVLEVAEEPGPFSDWIDKNTVSAVMKQLEWVRINYDVGDGL